MNQSFDFIYNCSSKELCHFNDPIYSAIMQATREKKNTAKYTCNTSYNINSKELDEFKNLHNYKYITYKIKKYYDKHDGWFKTIEFSFEYNGKFII